MGKFISRTITIVVVLCGICFVICNFYDATNIEDTPTNKINQNNNMLSMMLETDSGSGQYEMTSLSSWPTNGYVFNEQMSKCEQGSILRWDDANKKVVMEGNVSDKCYVFFDKYNPIKINSSSVTTNGNNIVITVNATSGTGSISKYFYSKDNGSNYVESTSNTYTFANLPIGKYDVKFYVMDSNGKKSETISKSIEINNMNLSNYIISKYTGTQGENGIYYHDASLTNGAVDNSYRFAGASDAVNNFVCFGSNVTPCPTDNLYRIIGVFGDKVKLIKSDYATRALLGTDGEYNRMYTENNWNNSAYKGNNLANIAGYTWNYKNYNTSINIRYGLNTWSLSNLNTTNLNTNFITNIGADWAAKISETTWKVGGNTSANIRTQPAKTAYQNEIVSPVAKGTPNNVTTYSAKVGLMYVSDYMYAASPTYWTYPGYSTSGARSDYRAATTSNWMYMGLYEWTISRNTERSDLTFSVFYDGSVDNDDVSNTPCAVRPVFYLSSSVNYVSGSGTAADPILIN